MHRVPAGYLGNVRAVQGGASNAGVCGEPHLVVDHNVDGPFSRVIGQVSEVECLVHHSLPSKSCISMEKYTHCGLPIAVSSVELLGPRLPLDNWVHGWSGRCVSKIECEGKERGEGRVWEG